MHRQSGLPTKREKARFVREICRSIEQNVLGKLSSVPHDWDGLELRALIADHAMRARIAFPSKTREWDYENICLIKNL